MISEKLYQDYKNLVNSLMNGQCSEKFTIGFIAGVFHERKFQKKSNNEILEMADKFQYRFAYETNRVENCLVEKAIPQKSGMCEHGVYNEDYCDQCGC